MKTEALATEGLLASFKNLMRTRSFWFFTGCLWGTVGGDIARRVFEYSLAP